MPTNKPSRSSKNKSISINGDVRDSNVFIGDNNLFQKIINYIFPSEKETLEHRNRRILLGHVENAWIKGVLDASLHGAALLDLGIKQDPEAVTKYPWAIKKESTDETLPAGTSMLEIFDSIGMGRSLLILGAPGSGKTTMLLELARQLIQRAREDVTYPIPMVFNLASWTEKLTLADWLAQELNNLYSVPRKTAPDWVKGNKLLLLLDGLDEVRQESRAKCVEAINKFRKEYGMTSLAVCSRSQDYADLKSKLSFEGAIEVQPLTQKQITEFFNCFGKEMAGIKQVLKKDSALREMAETPLFLSTMIMAYRDKQDVEIFISGGEKAQRKHLFDTYIERMFERPRLKNIGFHKQDLLHWLSWLANKMTTHNEIPYLLENMQLTWLRQQTQYKYRLLARLLVRQNKISTVDSLSFNWKELKDRIKELSNWVSTGLRILLVILLIFVLFYVMILVLIAGPVVGLVGGLLLLVGMSGVLFLSLAIMGGGLSVKRVNQITYPGQRLVFTAKNFLFTSILSLLVFGLGTGLISGMGLDVWLSDGFSVKLFIGLLAELSIGLLSGLIIGLLIGLKYGGNSLVQHYTLRFILARNNLLPWRLVPFLDHCVDLIFLRRVGGGYIFVHRLLMEHFAEMYVETPTAKGN